MEKEFLTYPLALRLKALGFNEPCIAYFNSKASLSTMSDDFEIYLTENDRWVSPACSAPTWQSAFDWFEVNHQLYPSIVIDQTSYPKYAYEISVFIGNPKDLTEREWCWNDKILSPDLYRTRIEARISCLEKLCEIAGEK